MGSDRSSLRGGFSLVELVIVVVIIGIIAAIAAPRVSSAAKRASASGFAASMRSFTDGIERYYYDNGEQWPSDGSAGVAPAELSGYVDTAKWSQTPPLGGIWDNETNDSGVVSAFGVKKVATLDLAQNGPQYRYADAILDDGRMNTGSMRVIGAGRYYLVLEEEPATVVPPRDVGTVTIEEDLGLPADQGREIFTDKFGK